MKPRSKSCFSAAVALLAALSASAQFRGFQAANVAPPPPLELVPGEIVEAPLTVRIRKGYHINSNEPAEDYLIPTRVEWNPQGVEVVETSYPEAELFTSQFSDEPLLVYSGEIVITAKLRAPSKPPEGMTELVGKLHYQACTDKACLAPTAVEFAIPLR